MAVHSTEVLIDPVGACVGQRGDRVTRVVDELRGEKIDIIKWSENPAEFIANALNPANVREVYTEASGQRSCIVVVPDNQLSLAIGKEGQNARLAAKLTGYKIDIKAESAVHEWEEEDAALAEQAALAQEAPDEAAPLDVGRGTPGRRPRSRSPARSGNPCTRQRTPPTHSPWRAARAEFSPPIPPQQTQTGKEVAPCQKRSLCANVSAAGR